MERVNSRDRRCFASQERGWPGVGGMIFLISSYFYFYYSLFPQQLEQSLEGMAKEVRGLPQTSSRSPLICLTPCWEWTAAQPHCIDW